MRKALAALLVAGVLVIAVWAKLSYKPVVVAGPAVPARLAGAPAAGWPHTAGLRLHVFNTGMVRLSPLLVGAASSRWRPSPAFVLEHPRRGLLVYDCGMGADIAARGAAALPWLLHALTEVRARPDRLLDVQMRAAGLDPTRVSMVILSHAHFDHMGQVAAFPQAAVVAGAGIRDNHRGERTALVPWPPDAVPAARWQEVSFAGTPAYATFSGSRDLLGDGSVVLLPGIGHTREDVMALVTLPGGPALLAGDAVPHREWLHSDDVQRVPDLPGPAAAVRNQVRALLRADPGVVLLLGHDLSGLPSGRPDVVLHHPEWFSLDAWPT